MWVEGGREKMRTDYCGELLSKLQRVRWVTLRQVWMIGCEVRR